MADDCVFCRIARGEIPASLLYKDDDMIAFSDMNPAAPVHVLIVPVEHISSLRELGQSHDSLIGRVHRLAARLAEEHGVADGGYRVVVNCGRDAGQSVGHLHFHLLGGRTFAWPPG